MSFYCGIVTCVTATGLRVGVDLPKKSTMKRDIVIINEELCNGCGNCITGCHEGALQLIDGKARLISELMCDGLGACIGTCPQGAITVDKRDAEPYNEEAVMAVMMPKGENTVKAHLQHLVEHGENEFLAQGIRYLLNNRQNAGFDVDSVISSLKVQEPKTHAHSGHHNHHQGGCPGSRPLAFAPAHSHAATPAESSSALTHWPVQLHLINPVASYFRQASLLVAADCVAYALGNFHAGYLKGKSLVIACPKLDHGREVYLEKLIRLIDDARVDTITVMIMEVPCCGGLSQLVSQAAMQASRKVPVKEVLVGVRGEILSENWL